jgi:hypothetical protein
MPFAPRQILPPEVALTHQGITVFHTYRNDEIESGKLTYQFTVIPDDMVMEGRFDVRELPEWLQDPFLIPVTAQAKKTWSEDEDQHIRLILSRAIESGSLAPPSAHP